MTVTIPAMPDIDVTIHGAGWPDITALAHKAVKTALSHAPDAPEDCEISLLLTGDEEIQELNRDYRGKNKPTNVLSFPQDMTDTPPGQAPMLGDIVLSLQTLQREAAEKNIPFEAHASHLVVHGLLHLLGYDHEDETQALEMESLEIKILDDLGIKNPYEQSVADKD